MERIRGRKDEPGPFSRLKEWLKGLQKPVKPDSAGLKREEALFRKMEYLLAFEGLYKQKHLSMVMLTKEAGSNRSYVSSALRHRGLSFSCYIGSLRVQRLMQIVSDEKYDSADASEVAEMCGFMSERAMNYYLNSILGISFTVLRRRAMLLREGERRNQ
ncbi:MAG: hypothetical protein J5699_06670 [Bacteroidales bacterium]|nr:hypothetical protein [Bacteroidales bacterium]